MAIDIASLAMAGLAYLLMKGGKGDKVKKGEVAPTPSKAPWPTTTSTMTMPVSHAQAASVPQYHEASAPVMQTNPDMPMMQKGIPGVHRAAQHAVDVLRAQQEANEFGKGSGTGTRHYRPSKHVTPLQRSRAVELTHDPEWRDSRKFHDADDPSVLYVQRKHGNLKAVEVWTSDY